MGLDSSQDILWGDILQDIENLEWELNSEGSSAFEKKKENKKYTKYSIILGYFVAVFFVLMLILFFYNKYIYLNSKDSLDESERSYVTIIKWYTDKLNLYLWDDTATSTVFAPNLEKENVSLIRNNMVSFKWDTNISYINKRDSMVAFVSKVFNSIKTDSQKIEKLKTDVWMYWFLPNDLNTVVTDSAIQRSFLSIESIKYITAIKIFSYIDSFTTELSTIYGYPSEEISKRMQDIINSWEITIQKYLIMCYLNPYEKSENWECTTIWDFDYDMTNRWEKLNLSFVKTLVSFIKWKLEDQDFPKLSIIFNTLDPQSNRISFTISINTFLEDEQNIIWKGILNPHIYIVSTMLNLLRESHFILWDTIKIDSLKVNKKKYKEVTVNSSNFTFDIPVQKAVEREIYDFVYGN